MMSTDNGAGRSREPRLSGKVALIFGAGSVTPGWGIGKATAVLFARHGAKIAAADISADTLVDTVGRIEALSGDVLGLTADVCVTAEIEAAVQRTIERFGRIDVLFNNVGLSKAGPLVQSTDEDWDRVAIGNLRAPFAACRAVVPHMARQGGGSIISTSSIAALSYVGYPHHAYSATKAGLIQLSRTIALEHAKDNIRSNCVIPGLIDTPRVAQTVGGQFSSDPEEVRRKRARQVPLGRMGTADDIAEAALFLASDAARYVTGTSLIVDGGLTTQCGPTSL